MPILYISAIIDIAVGSTVLLYSRSGKERPPITMLRVVLTAIVVAAVFGMKLPLWRAKRVGLQYARGRQNRATTRVLAR